MKYRIIAAASITLAASLGVIGTTAAQTAPTAPPPGSGIAQRLEQRKKERNVQLDDRTKKRLIDQCGAAQNSIRASQQRLTQLFTDRSKTYGQIDGKLWVAIGQLKLAQKDTFDLEKKRSVLSEKTATVTATSANFQQTLDDIVVMNCKADVVGFKALLDTARLYLVQLREQSAGINTYVVDDVKSVLTAQASELQPKTPSGGGQ